MKKKIAVIEGDGIGPEITCEGLRVLAAISKKYGHEFELIPASAGAGAYFETGECFPEETKEIIRSVDCVIKGPVGLSLEKMSSIPLEQRPEPGFILPLRKMLDTYACYRPVRLPKKLAWFSPLKPEIIGNGVDILMIRETVGGIYFGKKIEGSETGMKYASDECRYDYGQVERIAVVAFEEAKKRGCKMTNIHKCNVLATSRFWNAVVEEVRERYPDVEYGNELVDADAYFLCKDPTRYNGVMLLENMMGDILTDQGGGILGSLGLMPSACINPLGISYVEPSHGSAPNIAGQNKANPYSMIGSVALMLEKCFDLQREAEDIWNAMFSVFGEGYITGELAPIGYTPSLILSTSGFGDKVIEQIQGVDRSGDMF
jgi:3-isopropylmalate dehydrogenase